MKKLLVWILIMAVPAVVWALTPYEKDSKTGVVLLNCGKVLEVANPVVDTPLDSYNKTHFSGDIMIPTGQQAFEIIFKTKDLEKTIVSGTTPVIPKGKMCPLKAYIKIMPLVNEPEAPEIEVIAK